MKQLKTTTSRIPVAEEFKKFLCPALDIDGTYGFGGNMHTKASARSYLSRLGRLFDMIQVLKQRELGGIDICSTLKKLLRWHPSLALEFLQSIRNCAFDERDRMKKTITPAPYSDCRSALEQYISFIEQMIEMGLLTDEDNSAIKKSEEYRCVKKFVRKFHQIDFSKDELYKNILKRRTSESRLTGKVFYPIKTIYRYMFKDDRNTIDPIFRSLINKINILIDEKCSCRLFSDLNDDKALSFDDKTKTVKVFFKDGEFSVYSRCLEEENIAKLLKVTCLEKIDIDHKEAISNILNNNPNDYPGLKGLTEKMKQIGGYKEEKKEFYENNKNILDSFKDEVLNDLRKLIEVIELEMMYCHTNNVKGKR